MYDIVFITNIPAFYKINLFNEIGKRYKIKVIFISGSSIRRQKSFTDGKKNFDYVILNKDVSFEKRNKLLSFFFLFREFFSLDSKLFVFSGWEIVESLPLLFLSRKNSNGVVIESSIKESNLKGLHFYIKKLLISRFAVAFPSGKLQEDVLEKLKYLGKVNRTYGVGITNKASDIVKSPKSTNLKVKDFRFIYVGSIDSRKNIPFLVSEFNRNGKSLTLVGEGSDLEHLKTIANSNISFLGYKDNSDIPNLLNENDIFILPSVSEPWGLVIDEAIKCGLPVLVSENVGCASDMVVVPKTGIVFPLGERLDPYIKDLEENYDYYYSNVKKFDFNLRERKQIKAYGPL